MFFVTLADVISIAAGIALQNVPEGMAVIAPLVASGVSRKKAFLFSCITAVVEVDYEAAMKCRRWATASCSRNVSSVFAFS